MKKESQKKWFRPLIFIGAIILLPVLTTLIIIIATKTMNPYAKSCTYNGQNYVHLEVFDAEDNCNTCTCNNGIVSCTEMACIPIEENENLIIESEEAALSLVKEQDEIIEWMNLFKVNGGESSGTPTFNAMKGNAETCFIQTGKEEECYIVKAYEQLDDHNATYNWYYVTFDGEITSEF